MALEACIAFRLGCKDLITRLGIVREVCLVAMQTCVGKAVNGSCTAEMLKKLRLGVYGSQHERLDGGGFVFCQVFGVQGGCLKVLYVPVTDPCLPRVSSPAMVHGTPTGCRDSSHVHEETRSDVSRLQRGSLC